MKAFSCLRLTILSRAIDNINLPAYQGSALRGAFGHALKRAVCTFKTQECTACLLKTKCVYSYTFETPPPADTEVLRLYPFAPHPFVLNISGNSNENRKPGSPLQFGMTLVGRAIEFLPYFAYGFIQMGQLGIGKGRGRFDVEQIVAVNDKGENAEIVFEHDHVTPPETILSFENACQRSTEYASNEITVRFNTPLRVKYRGRLHDNPDFHIMIRNLLRRVSNLLYFHCGQHADFDFKTLIRKAETVKMIHSDIRWADQKRYSNRQKKHMLMGGIVGQATYRGDLAEFLPLLVLGSWVNIGKGTSFGLGSYSLSNTD
ncbi:CRISPR system precrRNA processing endoribonuclease RAMP protein Cas6 [Desulfococcaceae bacterium HSG9]|nr:CRISPR system precrRNA processing endoribonuclease RAMP protein Cas6 [Desulfococcaceae bacterium HSG9]